MYFCYFYPVGLDLARRRQPWLSFLLIASILGVFVWQRWLADRWAIVPGDLVFYAGHTPLWTAATALLLHAGWLHLVGNLIYLAVFLPALEDRLGPAGALLLFMVAGLGGNLAHGLAAWQGWLGQTGLGILGASGAISGLLGFALLRIPYARLALVYWLFSPLQGQNRAGRCSLPLPAAVLGWLLLQVIGAALAQESGSQVSYPAHLGGFSAGLIIALLLGGVREGRAEAALQRARRYLDRGEGLAASGAFAEHLALAPPEAGVVREYARALVMAGEVDAAAERYREAFRQAGAERRWDRALDILAEGRRCRRGLGLDKDELAFAAHQAEKAGDRGLALCLYQDLVLPPGDHPASNRAWVRLLMLLHATPERRRETQEWLDRARQVLPPGAWREYLEWRFTPQSAGCGQQAADPAGGLEVPGA